MVVAIVPANEVAPRRADHILDAVGIGERYHQSASACGCGLVLVRSRLRTLLVKSEKSSASRLTSSGPVNVSTTVTSAGAAFEKPSEKTYESSPPPPASWKEPDP